MLQVLPSAKSTISGIDLARDKRCSAWRKAVVARIRAARIKEAAAKVRRAEGSIKVRCKKAETFARAFDSSLSDAGSGLRVFKNTDSCRPITADERRYVIARKRPAPFEVPSTVRQLRSCILHRPTKKTRFELELGPTVDAHPLLSICHDEGPGDLPAFWFLFFHTRVVNLFDPLHRVARDMEGAAHACDCWSMIQDSTAVINYDHGPFLTLSRFSECKEAVGKFINLATFDDELLAHHFEELCTAVGDHPSDYGSPEHVIRVVQSLPDLLSESIIPKVKWTRWGSHHWSLKEFLKIKPHKELLIDIKKVLAQDGELCFERNCRDQVSAASGPASAVESTAASSSSSSAATAPVPKAVSLLGAAKAGAAGKSRKRATPEPQVVAELAASSQASTGKAFLTKLGSVDDYELIMADQTIWIRARLWSTFTNPVWKAHAAEYKGFHSDDASSLRYYAAYARGAYMKTLNKLWDGLWKPSVLTEAGFKVQFENKQEKAMALAHDSAIFIHEAMLSKLAFDIVFDVTRYRAMTHQHYVMSFPGQFAGLASGFPSQVKDTLAFCKRTWSAVQYCEQYRHVFKEIRLLWEAVPWVENEAIREVFVMLSEFAFEYVSPYVHDACLVMFTWGSSLINELGFQKLRDRLKDTRAKSISPQTAFATLIDSNVLGSFSRQGPAKHEIPKDPLPIMSRQQYNALSLPAWPVLDNISKKKTTWRSWSGLSKNLIPAAFSLMLDVSESVVPLDELPSAWHAHLATPKDVALKRGTTIAFLVQQTSKFGVFGIPCSIKTAGPQKYLVSIGGDSMERSPRWFAIVDCDAWDSHEVLIRPPIETFAKKTQISMSFPLKPARSLKVRAAELGFVHVPLPYVEKLFVSEVLKKQAGMKRPGSLLERVTLLIKAVIPDIDDRRLHLALQARIPILQKQSIVKAGSEFADSVLDSSDKQTIRSNDAAFKQAEDLKARRLESLREGSRFLEILGHAPIKLPAVKRLALVKPVVVSRVSLKNAGTDASLARKLVPQLVGCTVQYFEPKHCWKVYYPGALPATRTRTSGFHFSKAKCLRHCLAWTWQEHEKATGKKCPWSFVV